MALLWLSWSALGMSTTALVVAIGLVMLYQAARFARSEVDLQLARLGAFKDGSFVNKVVWLTGASQGLGKALAIRLAELGAKVIISSRRIDALQLVKDECKGCPFPPKCLPFDLLGGDSIGTVTETAWSLWGVGGVDILIHNAGAGQHAAAMATSVAVDEMIFKTNCLSSIRLIKAVVPLMMEKGKGQVVAICSLAGLLPSPGQAAYSMSKHALLGWFHSLAAELADTAIKFTLVCPGPIATGGQGQARVIFGTDGIVDHKYSESDKRMPTDRCAQHVLCAVAHKTQESWITPQPLLTLVYLYRLFPSLAWVLIRAAGPKRARMSDSTSQNQSNGASKDMYNIRELLFGGARKAKG